MRKLSHKEVKWRGKGQPATRSLVSSGQAHREGLGWKVAPCQKVERRIGTPVPDKVTRSPRRLSLPTGKRRGNCDRYFSLITLPPRMPSRACYSVIPPLGMLRLPRLSRPRTRVRFVISTFPAGKCFRSHLLCKQCFFLKKRECGVRYRFLNVGLRGVFVWIQAHTGLRATPLSAERS